MTPAEARDAFIDRLEARCINAPQIDCPVREYFVPGIYAREMSIPARTFVSGAVHKIENIVIVSLGRLIISTEHGFVTLGAGDTLICHPGARNAVETLEDSRWTNFFPNPDNLTDQDALVRMVSHASASELLGGPDNKQLAANRAAETLEH